MDNDQINPELQNLINEAKQIDAEHGPAAVVTDAHGSENITSNDNVTAVSPEMALTEATLVCNLMADGVHAIYPVLEYGPETRQTAIQKLAPVLVKYNLGSDFLSRWQVEIDAGVFFATLIYQSYAKVKAAKAEEEKAREAQRLQAGPVDSIYPDTI